MARYAVGCVASSACSHLRSQGSVFPSVPVFPCNVYRFFRRVFRAPSSRDKENESSRLALEEPDVTAGFRSSDFVVECLRVSSGGCAALPHSRELVSPVGARDGQELWASSFFGGKSSASLPRDPRGRHPKNIRDLHLAHLTVSMLNFQRIDQWVQMMVY